MASFDWMIMIRHASWWKFSENEKHQSRWYDLYDLDQQEKTIKYGVTRAKWSFIFFIHINGKNKKRHDLNF